MGKISKCPSCQNVIQKVKVEGIEICIGPESSREGFSYLCPSCNSVLGVQMDPIVLNTELKNEILNELPGASPQVS